MIFTLSASDVRSSARTKSSALHIQATYLEEGEDRIPL